MRIVQYFEDQMYTSFVLKDIWSRWRETTCIVFSSWRIFTSKYAQDHSDIPLHQELKFSTSEAFSLWMHGIQNAQYSIANTNVSANGKTYRTYICRRTGETATYDLKEYVLGDSANVNSRLSRSKPSCKMAEGCASRFLWL